MNDIMITLLGCVWVSFAGYLFGSELGYKKGWNKGVFKGVDSVSDRILEIKREAWKKLVEEGKMELD